MKAQIYINELDQEVEFEGEIMTYGSKGFDHDSGPYDDPNQWRVWWDTFKYTAEQNALIAESEDEAIEELEKAYIKEFSI